MHCWHTDGYMPSHPSLRAPVVRRLALACLLLVLAACAGPGCLAATTASPPTLILISIDGFRSDFLQRGLTPHLASLAADGVQADALKPAFPTLTFPNHYTLVTGLYPDHHGIVHNRIEGPHSDELFVHKDATSTADAHWWGGEPIWVGAERHGIRAATMFWPGSNAAISGVRPSYWKSFDRELSPQTRVDTVLGWLDLPTDQRPGFITLYFEHADRAGHDYGPDSPQVDAQLQVIDGALGRLIEGLAARGLDQTTNLVVVSDHGQAGASRSRTIEVDRIVDLERVRAVNLGVVAGFAPQPGQQRYADTTLLRPHEHMQCWRKDQIPARFHYGSNARIPPIICLADKGWIVSSSAWLAEHGDRTPQGEHGYDNELPEMRALFIAHGPAFRRGAKIAEFDNVDVYPLLAHLLGIPAARNDGNAQTLQGMLRRP